MNFLELLTRPGASGCHPKNGPALRACVVASSRRLRHRAGAVGCRGGPARALVMGFSQRCCLAAPLVGRPAAHPPNMTRVVASSRSSIYARRVRLTQPARRSLLVEAKLGAGGRSREELWPTSALSCVFDAAVSAPEWQRLVWPVIPAVVCPPTVVTHYPPSRTRLTAVVLDSSRTGLIRAVSLVCTGAGQQPPSTLLDALSTRAAQILDSGNTLQNIVLLLRAIEVGSPAALPLEVGLQGPAHA